MLCSFLWECVQFGSLLSIHFHQNQCIMICHYALEVSNFSKASVSYSIVHGSNCKLNSQLETRWSCPWGTLPLSFRHFLVILILPFLVLCRTLDGICGRILFVFLFVKWDWKQLGFVSRAKGSWLAHPQNEKWFVRFIQLIRQKHVQLDWTKGARFSWLTCPPGQW